MKLVVALVLATCFWNTAFAKDRDAEFSVGGGAGTISAAPWSKDAFSNTVSTKFREGAFLRYHMSYPNPAWELSYDHLQFGKSNFSAHVLMLSWAWRMLPEHQLHPVFAIGGGIAFTENFYTSAHKQAAVYRLRAGVEYELNPQFDVAFYLDHFSIFRDARLQADAHALAPMLAAVYYFSPAH